MKKIFSLILCGVLVIIMTGCNSEENEEQKEKETKNTLVCSSNSLSVGTDIYISKGQYTANSERVDDDPSQWSIHFSQGNEYIEKGEYKFIYENNHLSEIKAKETYKESASSEVTDKELAEFNKNDNYKASKKDGKLILEYNFGEENDLIKAMHANYSTKDELKKVLEEKGQFNCK